MPQTVTGEPVITLNDNVVKTILEMAKVAI
jgi:hypothetical protein